MEGPEVRACANSLMHLVGRRILCIKILRGHTATSIDANVVELRDNIALLNKLLAESEVKISIIESIGRGIYIGIAGQLRIQIRGAKIVQMNCPNAIATIEVCGDTPGVYSTVTLSAVETSVHSGVIGLLSNDEFRATVDTTKCVTNITLDDFVTSVRKRSFADKKIINVISDRRVIDGIGGCYRCEAIYVAKINPLSDTKDISDNDLGRLYAAIKYVTLKAYSQLIAGEKSTRAIVGLTITANGEIVKHITMQRRPIWYCDYKPS